MAPQVIASGVKQHLSGQLMHPFQATAFTINHFGSTQESFYPKVFLSTKLYHNLQSTY